mmetsp:Transcript_21996/g.65073  ORF Transcript_21996/g.65073 Transcript_21996/m.65073 type:complete len:203 (-) Transcript_21996:513-1121(-)
MSERRANANIRPSWRIRSLPALLPYLLFLHSLPPNLAQPLLLLLGSRHQSVPPHLGEIHHLHLAVLKVHPRQPLQHPPVAHHRDGPFRPGIEPVVQSDHARVKVVLRLAGVRVRLPVGGRTPFDVVGGCKRVKGAEELHIFPSLFLALLAFVLVVYVPFVVTEGEPPLVPMRVVRSQLSVEVHIWKAAGKGRGPSGASQVAD